MVKVTDDATEDSVPPQGTVMAILDPDYAALMTRLQELEQFALRQPRSRSRRPARTAIARMLKRS
jgi:hypothetical protein